ncbi:MAG: hypothetical protein HOD63_06040 [Bacteroidetes bacterium]|nr:hypothetical protein [Bacteroidota bacterium]
MKSTPFLKEIANHLLQKFNNDLSEVAVVFPNKRAGLFFRHYLNQIIDKPVWSPHIFDISAFIQSQSKLQLADKYSLVFKLYDSYCKLLKSRYFEIEDAEHFYPWGNLLIKDFNEVDKYLVDAKDIFRTVKELKIIDNHYDYLTDEQINALRTFWENVQISKNSEHKSKFLHMWEILDELYADFNKSLKSENLAYEGMIYRDVCENLEQLNLESSYKKIVFAGFNILNKSEEQLFKFLKKQNKALYYWDIDAYYLEKKNFPVGEHLMEMMDKFPAAEDFKTASCIQPNHKKIELIGVPLEVGQAKAAGNLVQSFNPEENIDSTAIVLAAEHLLFPLLQSIPENNKGVNVTMGYPMKNTRISSFLDLLAELQKHVKVSGDHLMFYYTDVLSILRHSLVNSVNTKAINEKIQKITAQNKVYISDKELASLFESAKHIFSDYRSFENQFTYFMQLLEFIYYQLSGAVEKEFVYAYHKELKSLSNTVQKYAVKLDEKLFFRLIKELINSTKLPFSGEPLQGIQVMGSLETRCLDFSKLIIMGMNEGYWPKNTFDHSFIPYNLRRAFELPTYELDDALYAYYFYRLLQKADEVFLIYNTETGSAGSGEISRYISQLKYDFDFEITEKILAHDIKKEETKPIEIWKEDKIIEQLNRYLSNFQGNKRLSPSALNAYIDCSLRFYFRYVSDLYEKDEVKEEIDHAMFGNILHHSMEVLYKNYCHTNNRYQIVPSDFEPLKKEIDQSVEIAFNRVFNPDGNHEKKFLFEGQNILIRNMIHNYVRNILKIDHAYAPFEIVSLEKNSKSTVLPYTFDVQSNQVNLSGIIDRVDLKGNVLRLLDYKTGKDEKVFGDIESLFDAEKGNRNKAAFQTILYSLIYKLNTNNTDQIFQPGIYNVRKMHTDNFDSRLIQSIKYKKNSVDNIEILQSEFESHLKLLLQDIFNPNVSFRQTEDKKKCEYCPYKGICNR